MFHLRRHLGISLRAVVLVALASSLVLAVSSASPTDASGAELIKRVKGAFSPSIAAVGSGVYVGRYTKEGVSVEYVRRGHRSIRVFRARQKQSSGGVGISASGQVALAYVEFGEIVGESGDWFVTSSTLAAGPVGGRMKRISREQTCEIDVDGRFIIQEICFGDRTKIHVYELAGRRIIRRATYRLAPRVITTTPLARPNGPIFDIQGRTLSVTSEHRVHVLDLLTGRIKRQYKSVKPLWGGGQLTDGTVVAYPARFVKNLGTFGGYVFNEFLSFGEDRDPMTVRLPRKDFEPVGTTGNRVLYGRPDSPTSGTMDVYAVGAPDYRQWSRFARVPSLGVLAEPANQARVVWPTESCGVLTLHAKPLLEPFVEPAAPPCTKP